jgi:hypothetical protein
MREEGVNMEKNSKETREERFKRVATRRTNDILRRIRILGNCSNRSGYAYTDEEVNKVFAVIEKELKTAKSKFVRSEKNSFSL